MVVFIALPGASWGCPYPPPVDPWCALWGSPHSLSPPALPPAPHWSLGGASRGSHGSPAAHPPGLRRLLRNSRLPPDRSYRRRKWPRPTQERKHNRRKLSVREPDQGGKHKHSRRTQLVLDHGMKTTTSSSKAAGLRKRTRKGEVTKKSRASRESVQFVRGAGVGVGDRARHGYGGHLVGSGARMGGPCWGFSRRS